MGSPELPSDENNISMPAATSLPMHGAENTTASDDSDLENADGGYGGYQPLTLDEETMEYRNGDAAQENDDDDDADDDFDYSAFNAPTVAPETGIVVPSIDAEVESEVWNAPRPESTNIVLDSTRTEQIMSAMANFTLPSSNIPTWAQADSDEKWKDDLLQRIRQRQSRDGQ